MVVEIIKFQIISVYVLIYSDLAIHIWRYVLSKIIENACSNFFQESLVLFVAKIKKIFAPAEHSIMADILWRY